MAETNYFKELNDVNVNDKTETKNGLTYLSWAWAWAELKKRHPDAFYTVYENRDGWNYFHDGGTAWVKTGVTVCGIEHIEYLPIMDNRNKSIPLGSITSFDTNRAIKRAITKCIADHGLGLYIYAGEDIPGEADSQPETVKKAPAKKAAKAEAKTQGQAPEINYRAELKKFITEYKMDAQAIVKECGLKPTSSNEEWKAALAYAIKKRNANG